MRKMMVAMFLCVMTFSVSGCGYNSIQMQDEAVNAAHAQVLSVYKKRYDLIPNLVEVVKGYATHEKAIFTEVAEMRAKTGQATLSVNASVEETKAFLDSQKVLASSLSRLIAVAENYPQLKADQNFRALQQQLEEVETQATAARNKYIRAIQGYNAMVRQFPNNLTAAIFGYHPKPQMQFEDEGVIKQSPRVKF